MLVPTNVGEKKLACTVSKRRETICILLFSRRYRTNGTTQRHGDSKPFFTKLVYGFFFSLSFGFRHIAFDVTVQLRHNLFCF